MPIVLFEQSESTYVNNIEQCENYFTLNYLSLANYSKKCEVIKDDVLIKFDLKLLQDEDITIRNAQLILPLNQAYLNKCSLYKGISLFAITENVCFAKVTWKTMPKAKYITTSYLTRDVIRQRYITFNITDIVVKWLNCNTPNFGFILCNNACDSIIISPKESSANSPKVSVEYSDNDECDCNCNYPQNKCAQETVFIELQLNDLNGGLIGPYDTIIFNEIVFQPSNDISYNGYSGEILISKRGCYKFHLEINVDDLNDLCAIEISLNNLTRNTYTDFDIKSKHQGKLVGNAIINVTDPVEKFTLTNNTNSTIQLSDVNVQATLTISKITQSG